MLNVSFAVLFVFLKNIIDENGTINADLKTVLEIILVGEFFEIVGQSSWEMFSSERETQLLIISILAKFLLKHEIATE